MYAPAVAIIHIGERRCDAAFGHDGVRLAQQRLADDAHFGASGAGFDRGSQARAACSDHQYVVGKPLEFRHL